MQKGVDYTGVAVGFYCHDRKGKYLFHRRTNQCRDEHGRWDCGGGGVRFGERLHDAVTRELQEELGTHPLTIEFVGFDEAFRENEGKRTHWISFKYRVEVDPETVQNNEPDKHDAFGWCTLDNLPSPLHSQIPAELEKYKNQLSKC